MATDLGFKGNFLLQMEFPDYSVGEIVTMFFEKALAKGYVFDTTVTPDVVSGSFQKNFDDEWRIMRNGRVAEMMLNSVRAEIKKRMKVNDDASPTKSKRFASGASTGADDIVVSLPDVQKGLSNM